MKILWVANSMMSEISAESNKKAGFGGGWIPAMSERIRYKDNIELAITVFGNVESLQTIDKNSVKYYIFPSIKLLHVNGGGGAAAQVWRIIINDFHPDVIHIYGTEQPTPIELVRNITEIPIIVSLQGILTEYYKHYYGDMDFGDVIRNTTIADILLGSSGYFGRKKFGKNLIYEQEILNTVGYVEGRTIWDQCVAHSINDKLIYYKCNRMLRQPFYEATKWNYDEIQKHTIFIHQGNYAIKGLHFVIPALSILRKKYPDIKLLVAGQDPTHKKGIKGRLSVNGYSKYIRKLAMKLDVYDCIQYIGSMDGNQVASRLQSVNVMLIPSAIENSPNSLAEAMIIGTPCVASDVGGNREMLDWGQCGIIYPYNDAVMLANAVDQIFANRDLAITLSQNAINTASVNHDPNTLVKTLIEIYDAVIQHFRGDCYE